MVGTGRGEVERNLLKEKEKKEREKQASKQAKKHARIYARFLTQSIKLQPVKSKRDTEKNRTTADLRK